MNYWHRKMLKKGITLALTLTYKCNLNCQYCLLKNGKNKRPKSKELNGQQWWEFIQTFPLKVKEIELTGGSPEMHPDFVAMVDILLHYGYMVVIYTNLMHFEKLNNLPESDRLMFVSTYHHCSPMGDFDWNYKALSKKYKIEVHEIDVQRLKYSRHVGYCDFNILKKPEPGILRLNPAGEIFTNVWDRNAHDL